MDLGFLFDDQANTLARWIAHQEFYIAAWTGPQALTAAVRKQSENARARSRGQTIGGRTAQNVAAANPSIKDLHRAFVTSLAGSLRNAGVLSEVLDTHAYARTLRKRTDPHGTSWNWRAVLPGDPIPMRADGSRDFSDALYPTLRSQIFPEAFTFGADDSLEVKGRTYAFVHMQLWPQTPRKFQVLFRTLAKNGIPYGLNITLGSGGVNSMTVGIKSFFAAVLAKASSDNPRYYAAIKELKARRQQNETIVSAQLAFCTWIEADEDRDLLRARQATLASLVQDWGAADTSMGIGDASMAFASSFPGFMRASSAPASLPPLREIIRMFPLDMASPLFDEGEFLLRSDSQLLPYVQGSSKQAAMTDATFAPMGSGKSLAQNVYNFAFLMLGETSLPYLSIGDIGRSSEGLVRLIQMALPPAKRHLAVFERLRFEKRYAINAFDLPLGSDEPLPLHMAFLVRLVTALCGDQETGKTDEAIPGLAAACIKASYSERKRDKSPKLYRRGLNHKIDEAIERIGVPITQHTCWWDIRDAMFHAGDEHLALQAAIFAVPVLPEIGAKAQDQLIAGQYTKIVNGEPITKYFFRKLVEAVNRIPLLAEPTQFSLGSARVVSLDLDEVSPKTDGWTSAIMFMLARHVLAGHFFQYVQDADLFESAYRDYQRRRIEEIRESAKRFFMDEIHRVTKNSALVDQVAKDFETNTREGRKWKLHMGFASQVIDDTPPVLMGLSQTRFIMGYADREDLDKIVAKFGLTPSARRAVTHIGKPTSAGANMVAMYRIGDGDVVQFSTLTVGPLMRWAFTSEANERNLRDYLYESLDPRTTIEALAKRYPRNGMLDREIEERKQGIGSAGVDRDASESILRSIARDMVEKEREREYA
jgi:intracellular multiplication protein IcmB